MNGYPGREEAQRLLREAERCNPGPWGDHSRVAARCAERIAAAAGMDPEKAYVLGLLHDIGRKFGIYHMPHIYNGWKYMLELGYDAAAKVCLTHSFSTPDFSTYIGKYDLPGDALEELRRVLAATRYDDYDRLIQLCDCLAGNGEVVDMETRMMDVKRRYGDYPQAKWDNNMALKAFFDSKCGVDVYSLLE